MTFDSHNVCMFLFIHFSLGGCAKTFLHDNIDKENLVLLTERYAYYDKNYEPINNESILFVGRYDLIYMIEPVVVSVLSYLGVCSNHSDDTPRGVPPELSKAYKGLGLVYFARPKENDPIEVSFFLGHNFCNHLNFYK